MFRRLVAPGAGYVPPTGEVWPYTGYEFINRDPALGDQAPIDANPLGSQLNNPGTFFVAFQDDGASPFTNRPHWALALNTDALDDELHRPLATARRRIELVGDGSTNLIIGTGQVWAGDAVDSDIDDLIKILDRTAGQEDFDLTVAVPGGLSRIQVVDILQGGVSKIGEGHLNTFDAVVVLVCSAAIPLNKLVYVYCSGRSSYATTTAGGWVRHLLTPSKFGVAAQTQIAAIRGDGAVVGSVAISLVSAKTSIDALLGRGLNEAYSKKTTAASVAPLEAWYPGLGVLNTPGAGAWAIRTGPALTVYSGKEDEEAYLDPMEACYRAVTRDVLAEATCGGSTGFVHVGSRTYVASSYSGAERRDFNAPGLASFIAMSLKDPSINPALNAQLFTYIPPGSAAVYSGGSITLTGDAYFWKTIAAVGDRSSVACGHDMIEFTSGGKTRVFVVEGLSEINPKVCTVLLLNGQTAGSDYDGIGTVRYLSTVFAVSDGAHDWTQDTAKVRGLFYAAPAINSNTAGGTYPKSGDDPASMYANPGKDAFRWGRFEPEVSGSHVPGYYQTGALLADGGIRTSLYRYNTLNLSTGDVHFDVDLRDSYEYVASNVVTEMTPCLISSLGASTQLQSGDTVHVTLVHHGVTGQWGYAADPTYSYWVDPVTATTSVRVYWDSIADCVLSNYGYSGADRFVDQYMFTFMGMQTWAGGIILHFSGSVRRRFLPYLVVGPS